MSGLEYKTPFSVQPLFFVTMDEWVACLLLPVSNGILAM